MKKYTSLLGGSILSIMMLAQPALGQSTQVQAPALAGLSAADLQAITDARIGIVKAALQLTPEQAKLWPPIEEAIRNRALGRQKRLAALQAGLERGEADILQLMRERADNLIARGTELKNVANAWQPLAQTLSAEQKERLALFASHFLDMVRDAVEARRQQIEDEADE
ncbi:Spy/CpxP family protein refolding chaperone [Prosthecomicrobium sp. N25]|uniref:Spy/CpxP family protein refolding chaperone n=1 Tax=Prosthecomicrobium sp. N25 TaxID=3129254 RepID=UPI0030775D64